MAWHKPTISPVVAMWYLDQESKPSGQCYSLDHDCDLVPAGLLVYWTMTDLVPAGLVVFNTGELRQIEEASGKVGTCPPQVLDICTTGLVMGPNWVIHYKVVLSRWRQLTSFSLWAGVRFGGIFFSLGKFLSCLWLVEIHVGCSFNISISLYFGFFC